MSSLRLQLFLQLLEATISFTLLFLLPLFRQPSMTLTFVCLHGDVHFSTSPLFLTAFRHLRHHLSLAAAKESDFDR